MEGETRTQEVPKQGYPLKRESARTEAIGVVLVSGFCRAGRGRPEGGAPGPRFKPEPHGNVSFPDPGSFPSFGTGPGELISSLFGQ